MSASGSLEERGEEPDSGPTRLGDLLLPKAVYVAGLDRMYDLY